MFSKKVVCLLLAFTIIAGVLLQGCGYGGQKGTSPIGTESLSDLSGAYLYAGSMTQDSLYTDGEESPVFIFTDSDVVLYRRELAYYSPRSSLGRYPGTYGTYPKAESKEFDDPLRVLSDTGADTSSIQQCRGYSLSEKNLELFLVDGDVWVIQYHRDAPYVFQLIKADSLELRTIPRNLARDESEYVVLVDTAAPKMLDIEEEGIMEDDVMKEIGESDEDAGLLVAYRVYPEDGYREYTVFEFESNQLRSRAEYRFYNSDDSYTASKGSAGLAFGACNDALRLLKMTYAYEVHLRMEFRGLDYHGLEDALRAGDYRILGLEGETPMKNESAADAFKAVLMSESKMLNAYVGKYMTLKEYLDASDAKGVFVSMLTNIDLDEDGFDEVILEICKGNDPGDIIESMVLRYHGGIIHSYSLAARAFNDLKQDGTFWFSGGADDSGFGRISFTDKNYSIDKITYSDSHINSDDNIAYFVNKESSTSNEFDKAVSQWQKIAGVAWYEFTKENIDMKFN